MAGAASNSCHGGISYHKWTELRSFGSQVLLSRWFMFFASLLIMLVASTICIFRFYIDIKTTLGYDQMALNLLWFANDVGANVGILAGFTNKVTPPWVVLSARVVMNLLGYLMIWLAITSRIPKSHLWQMCLYICVGANSQAFSHTGALVIPCTKMDAIASSSATAVVPSLHKYDVFLSFRGEDTRQGFTGHLYAALCRNNILAYIDDDLDRGEEISPALLVAIEKSKLSIVIFSENYASSRWCLKELVHIMDRGHIVLPVFYGIDPSDVRHQNGSYADAFVRHEKFYKEDKKHKVQEWRKALTAAANIAGFDSKHKLEAKLVEDIVKAVLDKLCTITKIRSADFTGLVGMEKHFEKMESLLHLGHSDVRIIGIWGMGGIGKTTLAEIVYKRFRSQFEGYFFTTFGDESNADDQHHLKEKLMSALLKDNSLHPHMHSSFAKYRLRRRKVLVVLDNVNEQKQLECLFGARVGHIGASQYKKDWFGAGSRIILVSRDKKVLKSIADEIYEVEELNFDEALKLFWWKAFGGDSPKTDLPELSKNMVLYAKGNPLALHVLGSHLHNRSLREWNSTLKKLEKFPHHEIDKVLKISYDALDDGTKIIFLDIAYCLAREDRDIVEEVLGDDSHIAINLLIEKSLITIKDHNQLWVHELLQHMAREIVRKESKEHQQHGRLYNTQDVYDVLKKNEGSPTIEALFLDMSRIPNDICLRPHVFEDMCNLRLLKIISGTGYSGNCSNSTYLFQGLDFLPNSLRYLEWSQFPLKSLPPNFEPSNLVKLVMRNSKLKELSPEIVDTGNLKELILSGSRELIKLPDLSQALKLNAIYLDGCEHLRQLPNMPVNIRFINLSHSGIEALPSLFGRLEKLEFLDLEGCQRLKSIPKLPRNIETLNLDGCHRLENLQSNIIKVKSFDMSCLSYCEKLEILPEYSEVMEHLEGLSLEGTGIQELCNKTKYMTLLFFLNSRNYEYLNFDPDQCLDASSHLSSSSRHGCFPACVLLGFNLTFLQLEKCNIQEILDWLGSGESTFERIPSSMRNLDMLYCLEVRGCKNLWFLPELPPSIRIVKAGECTSLSGTWSTGAYEIPYKYEHLFCNCLEMEKSAQDSVLRHFLSAVYNLVNISLREKYMAVPTCYPGDEIGECFSN